MRSEQYLQGRRAGIQWAITFLRREAASMNDPKARAILVVTARRMGVAAKWKYGFTEDDEEPHLRAESSEPRK